MGWREVIIADGDTRYRSQVTDFFRRTGYRVATADSVEQVLASVKENQAQVLLLGSGFSTKIAASDLVYLLKKCSRQLRIIMVSDEMTLAQTRQVRQVGIFYQALKPATASDTEELGQAVACAFERQRASTPAGPASLQGQPDRQQAAEGPEPGRLPSTKLLKSAVATIALILSGSYYLLAPTAPMMHNGNSLTIAIFLGFFALIVVGQLLPIFRIRLAPGRAGAAHHREITPRYGK